MKYNNNLKIFHENSLYKIKVLQQVIIMLFLIENKYKYSISKIKLENKTDYKINV
jgi:hypothetical protein